MRLYLISPLANVASIRELASSLAQLGHHITSTWHDVVTPGSVDVESDEGRRAAWKANVDDLRAADALIAFLPVGVPRASYCEIGYGLALGKPVVWCHSPRIGANRCIADSAEGVIRISSAEHMPAALAKIEAMVAGRSA